MLDLKPPNHTQHPVQALASQKSNQVPEETSVKKVVTSSITPDQVFKMLEKHVPQTYIVQCKDHNLFGVNEDVDEMMKKHMPMLLALVAEHPYLKLSVVTHGVKMFFDSPGGGLGFLGYVAC